MSGPTRTYEHNGLKVEWRPELCTHCENCHTSLPAVFDPKRRPWVDLTMAETTEITRVVGECPDGALKVVE